MRKALSVPAAFKLILFIIALSLGVMVVTGESEVFLKIRDKAIDFLAKENLLPESTLDQIAWASSAAVTHSISCVSDPNYICESNCALQNGENADTEYIEQCVETCNRLWNQETSVRLEGENIPLDIRNLEFFKKHEDGPVLIPTTLSIENAPSGETRCHEVGEQLVKDFCTRQVRETTPFKGAQITQVACKYATKDQDFYTGDKIDRYDFLSFDGMTSTRSDVFITEIYCKGYQKNGDGFTLDTDFELTPIDKAELAGLKCANMPFDSPSPYPPSVTCTSAKRCDVYDFWLPQDIGGMTGWGDDIGDFLRNQFVAAWGDPAYILYYEAIPDEEVERWVVDDKLNIWMVLGTETAFALMPGGGLAKAFKRAGSKAAELSTQLLLKVLTEEQIKRGSAAKAALRATTSKIKEPFSVAAKKVREVKGMAVQTLIKKPVRQTGIVIGKASENLLTLSRDGWQAVKNSELIGPGLKRMYAGVEVFREINTKYGIKALKQRRLMKMSAREFDTLAKEAETLAHEATESFFQKITTNPDTAAKYQTVLRDSLGIDNIHSPEGKEQLLKILDTAYSHDAMFRARVKGIPDYNPAVQQALVESVKETTGKTVSRRTLSNQQNARLLDDLLKEFESTGALGLRRGRDDLVGLRSQILDASGNIDRAAMNEIKAHLRENTVKNAKAFNQIIEGLDKIGDTGLREASRNKLLATSSLALKESLTGPNPYFRLQLADVTDAAFDGWCDAYANKFTSDAQTTPLDTQACAGLSQWVCSGYIEWDWERGEDVVPPQAQGCLFLMDIAENTAEFATVMSLGGSGTGRGLSETGQAVRGGREALREARDTLNAQLANRGANYRFVEEVVQKGTTETTKLVLARNGEKLTLEGLSRVNPLSKTIMAVTVSQELKDIGLIPIDINSDTGGSAGVGGVQANNIGIAQSTAIYGLGIATVTATEMADAASNKYRSVGVNALGLNRPVWGTSLDYTFDLPEETHKYFIELERDTRDDLIQEVPWYDLIGHIKQVPQYLTISQDPARFALISPCWEERIEVASGGSSICEDLDENDDLREKLTESENEVYGMEEHGDNVYIVEQEISERRTAGIIEGVTELGKNRRIEFTSLLTDTGDAIVIKNPDEITEFEPLYYTDPLNPTWAITDPNSDGYPYISSDKKAIKVCNKRGFWTTTKDLFTPGDSNHNPIPSIQLNPMSEAKYDDKNSPDFELLSPQSSYCYSGSNTWATIIKGTVLGANVAMGITDAVVTAGTAPAGGVGHIVTGAASWVVGVVGTFIEDAVDKGRKWPNH